MTIAMEHGDHNSSTLRTQTLPTNDRMLTLAALLLLFIGLLLLSSILLYTRCYLHRRPIHISSSTTHLKTGLKARVLNSLPVFIFSGSYSLECSICLSEFKEKELGRIIPECQHSFHIDCIDMWFYAHSTCPLCRAIVEEHHTADHHQNAPDQLEVHYVSKLQLGTSSPQEVNCKSDEVVSVVIN